MEVDLLPSYLSKPSLVMSYDFDVLYCRVNSYSDLTSDQKALGNLTVLEYWFQNGSLKVDNEFHEKFDIGFELPIRSDCRDHYLVF